MGKRLDTATGQWVDDGQPDPAAAAGTVAVPFFPPKPEHETTRVQEQRIESPQSAHAATQAAVASGAQLNANEQTAQVEAAESGVQQQEAGQKEAAFQALKVKQDEIEGQRQTFITEAKAADAAEIKDAADKHIAAGRARADYWKGNAAGEVFAAILRGIDRAASSFRGESGPTGVDRILEEKISAHERALVGEWEASKEAHELKAADRNKYEAELARRRIEAANQSELEIKLIGARAEKASAALGPERAGAIKAQRDAGEMKAVAALEQKRAADYDLLTKLSQTDRSPTATAGSNRPLSTETRELAAAAEEYKRLQARQTELLNKNGGKFPPLDSEDGQEFDTNDKAMTTILQKPLGKADSDALKAEGLQAAPGKGGVILQALGRKQGVKNYKTSLRVNSVRLSKDAQTKLALEGRGNAPTVATPAPNESWKGATKTISSGTYQRTGPGPNDWKKIK